MNVVSFGGGTNSTAMIIGMYLHKIPIDLILFADTGGEQPHTYEFMGTFNEWLVKHGIPKIVSVEYHDKDGNRLTLEQESIRRISGRCASGSSSNNCCIWKARRRNERENNRAYSERGGKGAAVSVPVCDARPVLDWRRMRL